MTVLRGTRKATYPFGAYDWTEIAPHEFQIARNSISPTVIGRIVEIPPTRRDKGYFTLPDYDQRYDTSELAVMGLELAYTRKQAFEDQKVKMGLSIVENGAVERVEPPPPLTLVPRPPVDRIDAAIDAALAAAETEQKPPPPEDAVPAHWISAPELARQMGVPDSTVYSRIHDSKVIARKVGREWRVAPMYEQPERALAPHSPRGNALLTKEVLQHREEIIALPAPTPEPEPAPAPEPEPDLSGWIDSRVFAKTVGISRDSVRRMAQLGRLHAVKIRRGKRDVWMVDPQEVTKRRDEPKPDQPEYPSTREMLSVLTNEIITLHNAIDRLEREVSLLRPTLGLEMGNMTVKIDGLVERLDTLEQEWNQPELPNAEADLLEAEVKARRSWMDRLLGN